MRIRVDDLRDVAVVQLLAEHHADLRSSSPPESCHVLDLDGLRRPEMTVWTAWGETGLLGCAALREIDAACGEVKSMRTVPAARGRGVASGLLAHLVAQARRRGYARLYLETGTAPMFAPARRLYSRYGFQACPPFADYRPDPHSYFAALALSGPSAVSPHDPPPVAPRS